MSYEITGTVKKVLPLVSGVGQKGPWGRQTVVLEYQDGNYTHKIALECSNKYEEFGKLKVGQSITARFDVQSREWQDKWFTSATCFSWHVLGGQEAPRPTAPTTEEEPF